MSKIPNIADIIAGRINQDTNPDASADAPGAIILEMQCNRRMAGLMKLAAARERIIHRMLDSSIEKSEQSKKPQLKIVN